MFLSLGLLQLIVIRRWLFSVTFTCIANISKCSPFDNLAIVHFSNVAVLGSLGATLLALGLFLYLSHSQTSDESEMVDNSRPGTVIANSRLIRMAIFLLANTLIASCAVFSVVTYPAAFYSRLDLKLIDFFLPVACIQINFEKVITVSTSSTFNSSLALNASNLISANESDSTNSTHDFIDIDDDGDDEDGGIIRWTATNEDNTIYQPIQTAPVYLFCCALSLAAISAFLRAGFVMKFLLMIVCISCQGCVLYFSDLYRSYDMSRFPEDRYVRHLVACNNKMWHRNMSIKWKLN